MLKISYIYSILAGILTHLNPGYFYNGTVYLFNSIYYLKANILTFPLLMTPWFLLVIYGLYVLFDFYKKNYPDQPIKSILIPFSPAIGFIGGSTSFLPMIGFNIYPVFIISIPIYVLFFFYNVFKHNFLNIRIFVKQSIIYSILIAILSLSYLITVMILEEFLQKILGYQSLAITVISGFFLGLLFIPLKNKIQRFVDKLFLHGTPEEIAQENELLKEEIVRTEKLKSVGILAGGVAHEIKNPLTALKTFTEYLPEKLEDKEFLKKFSRIVGHEVERIDGLVQELMEFAKPSPLHLKNVDIASLVDNTVDFLNSHLVTHNIKVIKNYPEGLGLFIKADVNRLRQALLNVFLNAVDAMNAGGTLTVSIRPGDEVVALEIRDTGIGIAAKDLQYIFDPFYTKKDHGTGLGLSITQRIISDHHGRILVESKPGQGTAFTIELPAQKGVEE